MLLYSDGLYEASDADGNELGMEGSLKLLAEMNHLLPVEVCQQLWREVIKRSGEQQDDVTLICLRRRL